MKSDGSSGNSFPRSGSGPPGSRILKSSFVTFRWRDPPVIALALLAMAVGFGQFGVVAALASVAKTFGHTGSGATFADEAGLSGTMLGIGLAVVRLSSIFGLPLAGLADRFGRRPTLLWCAAVGLIFTVIAAGSPNYWTFVVVLAVGRPFLSAVGGVVQVASVELTSSRERAGAVALVAAGYAAGAGLTAILHGVSTRALGFRGLFALAVFPLLALLALRTMLVEPSRFASLTGGPARPVLSAVGRPHRRRLALVAVVAFGVAIVTGPATSLVFIYAQNVRHVSGIATAIMVVGAGVVGLGGLLIGRMLADRIGRRPSVAIGLVGLVGFGILTYVGPIACLVTGYVFGVAAGAFIAPAGGAFANELFPTEVRASVAGWNIAAGVLGAVVGLLEFGLLADAGAGGNHAAFAALVTFFPAVFVGLVLLFLPETKGREPEELWG